MKHFHQLFIAIILIFTIVTTSGCGLFGTGTPTAAPLQTAHPTNTPLPISTFTTIPPLTQTATTIPTLTQTATLIPTETTTPIPTDTPTPAPTSAFTRQTQPDGSIILQDHQNGYQITLPPNWTALDLASGDFDKIISASADLNPATRQMINNFKPLLTQGAGILAIDTDPTHGNNNIYPVMLSFGVENNSPDLPLDFVIEANVQSISQVNKNAQILSSGVGTNKNNVQLGVINALLPANTSNGNLSVVEKLTMFKVNNRLVSLLMITDQNMQSTMAPIFQSMIDSITLLE